MTENKVYYVVQDNLGEYSVLKGEERIVICTELQYKVTAELFCDELNDLAEENEQLKQQIDEMITLFENSGLDYHISDELDEILNR